mgnify:FL=1
MEQISYIERIKRLKSEKKITNERLSELTGIPLGTLSKILAGMSDSPKLVNMISICQVLGCSLDYLVTGVPENHNNFLLSDEEIRMIENYRKLDAHGKEMTSLIIYKESERAVREQYVPAAPAVPTLDKVLSVPPVRAPFYTEVSRPGKRTVLLYDLPVSAGTGEYLDEEEGTEITIPDTERTRLADYALRISGNSMEPKFRDGDILLVEDCDGVQVGELGIFVLDGSGYFKKFGGDRLISLNPEYAPILLKDFSDIHCTGRVVGKLRRK